MLVTDVRDGCWRQMLETIRDVGDLFLQKRRALTSKT